MYLFVQFLCAYVSNLLLLETMVEAPEGDDVSNAPYFQVSFYSLEKMYDLVFRCACSTNF